MLPGQIIIRQCSKCSGLLKQKTIITGNTFGAKCWTDGKMEAPMLPESLDLVKCPHCNSLIWINRQVKVDEIEPWGYEKYTEALHYVIPLFKDYIDYITTGKIQSKTERQLRLRAWWAGNDKRRNRDNETTFSVEEIDNLKLLLNLLEEKDEKIIIMKAEIMRELGDFDASKNLLSKQFNEDMIPVVTTIKNLIEQEDRLVREIIY